MSHTWLNRTIDILVNRNKDVNVVQGMVMDTDSFREFARQIEDVYSMIPAEHREDARFNIEEVYSSGFSTEQEGTFMDVWFTVPMTDDEYKEELAKTQKERREEEEQEEAESLDRVLFELNRYPQNVDRIARKK